jgi:hypothetical protein
MKRYDIHTENKDAKWIENLLSLGFDGFTIVKGAGFWKGEKEKSLDIIIYTDNTFLVRAMAERIKAHNKQDAVLVTETDCKIDLI